MKINIVKQEKGYIAFEFSGEGHTMLNLLQSSLLEDKNVEMAGYSKPHPLMNQSRLFVKLRKGEDVLGTVKKAAENADGKLNDFIGQFEKSLSEL